MKQIDWEKTGYNLAELRNRDLTLRRNVCKAIRFEIENSCPADHCETCRYEMDRDISRKELATVFHVTESVIGNWENARTRIDIEYLLYYCEIAEKDIYDILVFVE